MANQFKNSYLLQRTRCFFARVDQHVRRIWQDSRTGALWARWSQIYRQSFTRQLLTRDLVQESALYAGLLRLGQKAGAYFAGRTTVLADPVGRQLYGGLLTVIVLTLLLGLIWLLPGSLALWAVPAFLLSLVILCRAEIGVYAAALLLPFLPLKALLALALLTLVSFFIQRRRGRQWSFYFSPTWIPILLFALIALGATLTSVTFGQVSAN